MSPGQKCIIIKGIASCTSYFSRLSKLFLSFLFQRKSSNIFRMFLKIEFYEILSDYKFWKKEGKIGHFKI